MKTGSNVREITLSASQSKRGMTSALLKAIGPLLPAHGERRFKVWALAQPAAQQGPVTDFQRQKFGREIRNAGNARVVVMTRRQAGRATWAIYAAREGTRWLEILQKDERNLLVGTYSSSAPEADVYADIMATIEGSK